MLSRSFKNCISTQFLIFINVVVQEFCLKYYNFMMFKREELITATGAESLKNECGDAVEYSISTDTRTIQKGDIYLPLKGESFDGENFIENALKAGAAGYFTSRDTIYPDAQIVLKVNSTLDAYLNLAKYYRRKINPLTVAITGSSGKTTTKEMVYSVLSQKFKTHKTYSNHNNEIGFCQTVLGMDTDTQALIVEMGMRGLGEIELISTHLEPDYAIITNSGTAHIGRLGSLDNIAEAKCEIASGLNKNGALIALNQEIIKKHLNYEGQKIYYSLDDVNIIEKGVSHSIFEYKGNTYKLNVEGDYNIENSLAAIELGLKTGLTPEQIKTGLESYHHIEKRWEVKDINGIKIINDSYNANPDSMKASVKTFIELYKNPVVILGNMGELGENEIQYHKQVGQTLAGMNKPAKYCVVGNLAEKIGEELEKANLEVHFFQNNKETADYISKNISVEETVFLKASRSMKFEEIIDYIRKGTNK